MRYDTHTLLTPMARVLQDFWQAGRTLCRAPGFAAAAVVALMLGIGPTLALFSVVDSVLIRALPYPEPDRIVYVGLHDPATGALSPPHGHAVIERLQSLATIRPTALVDMRSPALVGLGPSRQVFAAAVTESFYDLFGATTVAGRLPDPRRRDEALLSSTFSHRQFSNHGDAVGKVVELDGHPLTSVGVVRADFFPQLPVELWFGAEVNTPDVSAFFDTFGRLAPGATMDAARAELASLTASIERESPGLLGGERLDLQTFRDSQVGFLDRPLLTFLATVALVVLIACVNVANLLLARGVSRERDFAIRRAIGGTRGRLLSQALCEALLLAGGGTIAGLLLASWMLTALLAVTPAYIASFADARLTPATLGFASLLAVAVALIFGAAPSLRRASVSPASALQAHGSTSAGRPPGLMRALVAVEVALATLVLVGACFLAGSLARQLAAMREIATASVATVRVSLPQRADRSVDRVIAHALTDAVLSRGDEWWVASTRLPFFPAGRTSVGIGAEPMTLHSMRAMTADYFRHLGIAVVQGRGFTPDDRAAGPRVAIVNEAMAAHLVRVADSPALGQVVRMGGAQPVATEIVGVVADQRPTLAANVQPEIYVPLAQAGSLGGWINVMARTASPAGLATRVRAIVEKIDSRVPVSDGAWLDDELRRQLQLPLFRTTLLVAFGSIALLLTVFGVATVVTYAVASRSKEIAIRVSLGARPADIIRTVGPVVGVPIAVGLLIGTVAATRLIELVRAMLFELRPEDPRVYAAAVAVFASVAVLATWWPIRRALRSNPADVLRLD